MTPVDAFLTAASIAVGAACVWFVLAVAVVAARTYEHRAAMKRAGRRET